jgi:hypothetical protein
MGGKALMYMGFTDQPYKPDQLSRLKERSRQMPGYALKQTLI